MCRGEYVLDTSVRARGFYAFNGFRLDALRRTLTRDGRAVLLSGRVFDALLYLVENPGRIIEKDDFLNAVWGGRFVEEANLSQTIFILRKTLKDAGADDNLIATIPGRGYSLTAQVLQSGTNPVPASAIGQLEPALENSPPIATDIERHNNQPLSQLIARPSRFRLAIAAACALLLIAGAGLYYFQQRARTHAPSASKTLVLADFQNLTGDPALGVVLGKVLQIELAQSPYLNVLSQQRVSETLQQMERPKDAPVTAALAQEVCARNQGDAVISGTVARVGTRYLVTLEAKDCVQGALIMAAQASPGGEGDLPGALGAMTLKAREALRETAETMRRFDVPIAQATTASFAALRAYSLGERLRVRGDTFEAMQAFKHAIELDPSFALAWLELGNCYLGSHEYGTANEAYRKAFALRAHATEYQRFQLIGMYYSHLGDWVQGEKTYRLWTQTYPNDWLAWSSLATQLGTMAHYGEAIEAGRVALRLNPDHYRPYHVLSRSYERATRFSEAKAVAAAAIRKGVDNYDIHQLLYQIAYVEGDAQTMAAQVAREKGQPTESDMIADEARAAATSGQLRRSEALFAQAVALGRPKGPDYLEEIAGFYRDEIEAVADLDSRAEAVRIASTMTAPEKQDLEVHAMARLGEYGQASSAAEERATRSPDNGDVIELENTMAEIDLGENRPADAIAALQPVAVAYDLQDFETPAELGRAWLALDAPDKAAAEYLKILANRGVDPNSPLYPLAYLGLARALHMENKDVESRATYKQLFAFWRNADSDLPVLHQAKAEYSRLQIRESSASGG